VLFVLFVANFSVFFFHIEANRLLIKSLCWPAGEVLAGR
jgi:hypothetical protein